MQRADTRWCRTQQSIEKSDCETSGFFCTPTVTAVNLWCRWSTLLRCDSSCFLYSPQIKQFYFISTKPAESTIYNLEYNTQISLRRQIVPLQETRQKPWNFYQTLGLQRSKSLSKFIGSVLFCYYTINIAEICYNSTDSTALHCDIPQNSTIGSAVTVESRPTSCLSVTSLWTRVGLALLTMQQLTN